MVITVTLVRMMKVTRHQVVGVVSMRDRFMAATRAVLVTGLMSRAVVVRCARRRVRLVDGELVLVHVIQMGMMKMPFVQIIDVTVVLQSHMTAAVAMDVAVLSVLRTGHL